MSQRFLEEYRALGNQALRVERVLAGGRVFLTLAGFLTIYFDPAEPARFAALTYASLAVYVVYALIVLLYLRRASHLDARHGRVLHIVDMFWASALTFFSEGPVSPFFLFFLFVVLAAAYRWGFRETIATALLTVGVYLSETFIAAVGPWKHTWFAGVDFALTPVLIRTTNLIVTGFLLAYLAEQEKQSRAEVLATTDAMRQPRLEIGLGGSVGAIARLFHRVFRAAGACVVIAEQETGRTMLWQVDASDADNGPANVRRVTLSHEDRETWLFPVSHTAWCAARTSDATTMSAMAASPDDETEHATVVRLPEAFANAKPFQVLAAVDFGLPGEWAGRIYLYDPAELARSTSRLHFLNRLATRTTPVLSNVFLLRRLRTRAGAAERARVARELHDGTIQALIGVEMEIEALLRRGAQADAATLLSGMSHIQVLLRDEVMGLRELMQELRPVDLDSPQHLPDALAALVEKFRRDSGMSARFVAGSTTDQLPLRTAMEIFRIVQEALVNARKHSRARHVVVRLDADAGGFELTIEDDGRGFDFDGTLEGAALEHFSAGPALIKERVRAIGGRLAIKSARQSGSRIEVTFGAPTHV